MLPFENLSGDADLDYLADAFTEDLITDLSRIRDAFVISRSTTFTYRGRSVDVTTVAEELGVRYVLEGSLRMTGERVRINAQLIDGENDSHLWSNRYERDLGELFSVQDNVTGRIASVLRAELRVADERRQGPKATRDAWDHALRGNVILYNHQSISDYQRIRKLGEGGCPPRADARERVNSNGFEVERATVRGELDALESRSATSCPELRALARLEG